MPWQNLRNDFEQFLDRLNEKQNLDKIEYRISPLARALVQKTRRNWNFARSSIAEKWKNVYFSDPYCNDTWHRSDGKCRYKLESLDVQLHEPLALTFAEIVKNTQKYASVEPYDFEKKFPVIVDLLVGYANDIGEKDSSFCRRWFEHRVIVHELWHYAVHGFYKSVKPGHCLYFELYNGSLQTQTHSSQGGRTQHSRQYAGHASSSPPRSAAIAHHSTSAGVHSYGSGWEGSAVDPVNASSGSFWSQGSYIHSQTSETHSHATRNNTDPYQDPVYKTQVQTTHKTEMSVSITQQPQGPALDGRMPSSMTPAGQQATNGYSGPPSTGAPHVQEPPSAYSGPPYTGTPHVQEPSSGYSGPPYTGAPHAPEPSSAYSGPPSTGAPHVPEPSSAYSGPPSPGAPHAQEPAIRRDRPHTMAAHMRPEAANRRSTPNDDPSLLRTKPSRHTVHIASPTDHKAIDSLLKRQDELAEENKLLKKDKTRLLDQLSGAMSRQMSRDESDLENISVKNRPMKVLEEYDLFCCQEWLEAKNTLDEESRLDEKEKCQLLCSMITRCYGTAIEKRESAKLQLAQLVRNPFPDTPYRNTSYSQRREQAKEVVDLDKDLEFAFARALRNSRDDIDFSETAKAFLRQTLGKDFRISYKIKESAAIKDFVISALTLSWKMVLQQPPMTFETTSLLNRKFDELSAELHYGSVDPKTPGACVDYYVYPALFHGEKQMKKAKVILTASAPPEPTPDYGRTSDLTSFQMTQL